MTNEPLPPDCPSQSKCSLCSRRATHVFPLRPASFIMPIFKHLCSKRQLTCVPSTAVDVSSWRFPMCMPYFLLLKVVKYYQQDMHCDII